MRVEQVGKYAVIAFIVLGLCGFVYEKLNGPKLYKGSAQGYDSEIVVEVLAKKKPSGKVVIYDVKFDHEDTPEIGGLALENMKGQLKAKQNIDEVDVVAGATYSSKGFINAVKDALSKVE